MKQVAVFSLLAAIAATTAQMSCTVQGPGVSYDLSPLMNTVIHVQDNSNDQANHYDYFYSICTDIGADAYPSTSTTTSQMCATTTGDNGVTMTGPAPAFQVCNNCADCKRLGDSAANGRLSIMGADPRTPFRDPKLYAKGVMLEYHHGNVCRDPRNATNFIHRKLNIVMECYDRPLNPQPITVVENVRCEYMILVKDRAACPNECIPAGRGRICNAHGICGYDTTANRAKCFCNNGWSGDYCDTYGAPAPTPTTPSFGGNIAGGFFGGMALGAALIVGFFVYRAWSKGRDWKEGLNVKTALVDSGSSKSSAAPGGFYDNQPSFMGSSDNSYTAPALSGSTYVSVNDGPLLSN